MGPGQRPGGSGSPPGPSDPFAVARAKMVNEQLMRRGIEDPRVLDAMGRVPREAFVEPKLRGMAYDDRPLPIGFGQTISQPFMVARATELAQPQSHETALEVGAGCGYQAAVLSLLCSWVFAVDIVLGLVDQARAHLAALGYSTVTLGAFDGSGGWNEHAPYDVIIVSAGAPQVPVLLLDQLRDGGRLVAPIGPPERQMLTRIQRQGDQFITVQDVECRYVNLIGRFGVGSEPAKA